MQRPDPKKRMIQLAHIAKAQLRMDDDIYRANLKAWTGKSSTKDMSLPQLEKVHDGFKSLGFKPVTASKKLPGKKPLQDDVLRKLGQIWTQMAAQGFIHNSSYTALEAWAVKQSTHLNSGVAIERLEWMTEIASSLVEQLKRWHRRLMLEQLGQKQSTSKYPQVLDQYMAFIKGGQHVRT